MKIESLILYATMLELDMRRFTAEMTERIYLQRVHEHRRSGELLNLRASPSFFLNDEFIDVSFGLNHLEDAVRRRYNQQRVA